MEYYDVVVLGGGVIGVTAALCMQKSGISTAIIEHSSHLMSGVDNRVFALSKKSKDVLCSAEIWKQKGSYCPIDDIMIYDGNSSNLVHYNYKVVGSDPMGYIVEGKELKSWVVGSLTNVTVYTSSDYAKVEVDSGFAEISLSDGRKIVTRLIVCSEGKNSRFRKIVDIGTLEYDFNQTCITCNVTHEKKHQNKAIEHFFSSGPFAILPMIGENYSSIVWTEKCNIAELLMKLPTHKFEKELQKKCFSHLGKAELNSERYSYRISMIIAKKQYTKRAVLIGDSAHCIHPIAGQGLNLGIRDVKTLTEVLLKYHKTGSDIGQEFILEDIAQKRVADNFLMSMATTGINAIFSSNSVILRAARGIAMSVVELSPSIKKRMVSYAMGIMEI